MTHESADTLALCLARCPRPTARLGARAGEVLEAREYYGVAQASVLWYDSATPEWVALSCLELEY